MKKKKKLKEKYHFPGGISDTEAILGKNHVFVNYRKDSPERLTSVYKKDPFEKEFEGTGMNFRIFDHNFPQQKNWLWCRQDARVSLLWERRGDLLMAFGYYDGEILDVVLVFTLYPLPDLSFLVLVKNGDTVYFVNPYNQKVVFETQSTVKANYTKYRGTIRLLTHEGVTGLYALTGPGKIELIREGEDILDPIFLKHDGKLFLHSVWNAADNTLIAVDAPAIPDFTYTQEMRDGFRTKKQTFTYPPTKLKQHDAFPALGSYWFKYYKTSDTTYGCMLYYGLVTGGFGSIPVQAKERKEFFDEPLCIFHRPQILGHYQGKDYLRFRTPDGVKTLFRAIPGAVPEIIPFPQEFQDTHDGYLEVITNTYGVILKLQHKGIATQYGYWDMQDIDRPVLPGYKMQFHNDRLFWTHKSTNHDLHRRIYGADAYKKMAQEPPYEEFSQLLSADRSTVLLDGFLSMQPRGTGLEFYFPTLGSELWDINDDGTIAHVATSTGGFKMSDGNNNYAVLGDKVDHPFSQPPQE